MNQVVISTIFLSFICDNLIFLFTLKDSKSPEIILFIINEIVFPNKRSGRGRKEEHRPDFLILFD